MKHTLIYLLLSLPLFASAQIGADLDLGGESTITSITPLRNDSTIDMRQRWLGLTFSRLIVDPPSNMNTTTSRLLRELPYNSLSADHYLADIAAYQRYFLRKAYLVRSVSDEVVTATVEDELRPRSREHYPLVRATIMGASGQSDNHRFMELPPVDSTQLDTSYWWPLQQAKATLSLYQRTMTEPTEHDMMLDFWPQFTYERYYQNSGQFLRQAARDLYVMLHLRINKLSNDPTAKRDTLLADSQRCAFIDSSIRLCEADIMAYHATLSTENLSSGLIAYVANLQTTVKDAWDGAVGEMEAAAIAFDQCAPGMTAREHETFAWPIERMRHFAQTYRAIQDELNVFLALPLEETNQLQLLQLAEYFRVLDSILADRTGYAEAKANTRVLKKEYLAQVWRLEKDFMKK